MKLFNRNINTAFPIEKISAYEVLSGELQLREKEQSLRWEASLPIIEAVLLGKPKIQVIDETKEGSELLHDSLLLVKINGEPALGPVPLMGGHARMASQEGLHSWFDADFEDGSKNGIFIVHSAIVEATILSPWAIETGHRVPKIRVTIEADLCRTIREGKFKLC